MSDGQQRVNTIAKDTYIWSESVQTCSLATVRALCTSYASLPRYVSDCYTLMMQNIVCIQRTWKNMSSYVLFWMVLHGFCRLRRCGRPTVWYFGWRVWIAMTSSFKKNDCLVILQITMYANWITKNYKTDTSFKNWLFWILLRVSKVMTYIFYKVPFIFPVIFSNSYFNFCFIVIVSLDLLSQVCDIILTK